MWPMICRSQPTFEQLELRAQLFARDLVKRKACPCCVSRALLFAAVELGYETDTLPLVRDMLQSLLNASAQDMHQPVTH
jgi:hypothetical protein